MKKNKRIVAMLIMMLVFVLSACGENNEGSQKAKNELVGIVWQNLFDEKTITFNDDKTCTYLGIEGTWTEAESGEISVKYISKNFLGEVQYEVIGKKIDTEYGLSIEVDEKNFYDANKIDEIRLAMSKPLGETVSTDIASFTLDDAQLAMSVGSLWTTSTTGEIINPNEAFLPLAEKTKDTPGLLIAAKGRSMVSMTFTLKNNDRGSIELANDELIKFSIIYNGNSYSVNGYNGNGDKDGSAMHFRYCLYSEQNYTGNSYSIMYPRDWSERKIPFAEGAFRTIRTFGIVGFEPNDYNDEFYYVVQLKNSKDIFEGFLFKVN